MPRVSIVMSVYNGEAHIGESVRSIVSQRFTDFEFIIVNDGSTDSTGALLSDIKDPRIRIIEHENQGLTKSLNLAIGRSTGEYIARMDADDVSLPDRLGMQVGFMDGNADVGVVGTGYMVVDNEGRHIEEVIPRPDDVDLRRELIRHNPFFHSSVMFRREVFEKVGPYDERVVYAQDYELYFRVAQCFRMACLQEVLMLKRMSGGMITIREEGRQKMSAIRAKTAAIRRGQYPWWCYFYILRPFISIVTPGPVKGFLRRHLLGGRRAYRSIGGMG